jgi:hypothetical protein
VIAFFELYGDFRQAPLDISFAVFHPWGCSTYASATTTSTPVR